MRLNKKRKCAVFVFDGFADHQIALTLAWLNGRDNSHYVIETFSSAGAPVISMSGFQIVPHTSLKNMDPEDFDLLLLPGGDKWESGDNLGVFSLIMATIGKKPVAAICEAVLAFGDLGLLNTVPHTSNFPGYIRQYCTDYEGQDLYQDLPCVDTGDIITINGLAITDLACEILKTLGVYDEQKAQDWKELSTLQKI